MHVTNDVAALLNLPASHTVHSIAPTELLNFPAIHAAHTPVDELSRYVPATHDDWHTDDPAGDHIPDGQGKQSAIVFFKPPT